MKRVIATAFAVLLSAAPASAQHHVPATEPDTGTPSFERPVSVVATNGSRTFVAGDFFSLGTRSPDGAVVSAASGEMVQRVDVGWVQSVIPDHDAGWYVGLSNGDLHRVRADGSVDPTFFTEGDSYDVRTLALSPDGTTLWAGSGMGLRAVDARTGSELAWESAAPVHPSSLALSPDGRTLYSGGWSWDGEASHSVVALDAATGAVRAWGPTGGGGAIAVSPDGGTVYAGVSGYALALDAATLTERWRTPGNWETSDIALTPDGAKLFMTDSARLGGPAVMQYDTATGERTPFTVPVIAAGSIAISPDGETAYLGRAIVTGWPQQGALAFATRDGALLGWAPGQQDRYSVDALAVARDGRSVFLESSPTVGTRRQQAAMLDETGGITPWSEPNKLAGQIGSIHLDGDGTVYYTRLGSTPAISAVTADGTLRWRLAFGGGAGTFTLTPDEQTLYVTGSFTSLGGQPRPGLAAVRAADGALLPWPLTVQGGNVEASVFSSDGRTQYLKGTFTSVNGVPRAGLAAVDTATNAVLPFNPTVDGRVGIMRLTPDDSKLIVGGTFGEVDTPSRAYLLGLRTTDGAIVFRPPTVKSNVRTFVPLLDNRTLIVASGSLLWSFDTRDSGELGWRIDGCGGCVVNSLALDPDGRTLHVAGVIVIGGQQYHYLRLAVSRVPTAPVNGRPPAVVGGAQPGRFVECDPGTWSGHPSQYRFSWSLDGTTVPEFTGREFLVMEPDVGRTLGCSVRAFGAGTSATADSAPVSVTAGASPFQPVPRRTALPLGGPEPTPTPTPTATPEPIATPVKTVFGGAPPEPTATPAPEPPAPAASLPSAPLVAGPLAIAPALPDRIAPRVTVRRATLPLRFSLSEAATVTTKLRGITRNFTLAAGTHTFTARRLTGRVRLPRGRHALTLRLRDAVGNARVVRFRV